MQLNYLIGESLQKSHDSTNKDGGIIVKTTIDCNNLSDTE